MRFSRAFIPTLKEDPADGQLVSHILLVRGGFIRRVAAGIYDFLPLGWRVLRKIEAIVRSEMDRAGAQELLMPAAIPAELWQESGRWEKYGPELLRFADRKGSRFCFGPTHEEVVTDLVRREVKSYRDLPLNLYQIQTKFRDELRPRAGLIRGREFIMKDAYSFDVSPEKALESYQRMVEAYGNVFRRCGLSFRMVAADSGAIGGSRSSEFQVLAASGDDSLVVCDACDHAANVEQAEPAAEIATWPAAAPLAEVATPGAATVADVAGLLGVPSAHVIKTLVYIADGRPVAVLVRGDRAVNEVKLKRLLGATELALAQGADVAAATGAPAGFAGPVGLTIPIHADQELRGAVGAVVGGNRADIHLRGFDIERDAQVASYAPLRLAEEGDGCPLCRRGRFQLLRGIEVGHVFVLGTVYSEPMGCTFLDESGASRPMEMGCYGIGITRTAAAAIEQHHDERGIAWPMSIAPFHVAVLALQQDAAVLAAAERIYDQLTERGVEVLFDDRAERAGAKFSDADLIGIPLRLVVGARSLAEGKVELKARRASEAELVPIDAAAELVAKRVAEELAT
jgi:prolyl-tRNA synthetase